MKFTSRLDASGLRLDQVKAAAAKGRAQALGQAVVFYRGEANKTIPIEEGTLQRSGGIAVDEAAGEAAAYWDSPYAVRQHEDTSLRHDPGRRAKWAELTLREQNRAIMSLLADGIRKSLR